MAPARPWRTALPLALAGLLVLLPAGDAAAQQERPALRPLHDLVGLAPTLASDGWAVLVAPLHMGRDQALGAGAVLVLGVAMYAADGELTDAAREGALQGGLDGTIHEIGTFFGPLGLMGDTWPWYAAAAVTGYALRREGLKDLGQELLFSHWIAGLSRKAVGEIVGRMRPEEGYGPYEFRPGEGSSFPSGHASTITQVAAVLAHHVDFWPADAALYAMAAAVVYERTSSGKHWASDSWIGAAWGWAVAELVMSRRGADRTDFVPLVDPVRGLVGLRVATPF